MIAIPNMDKPKSCSKCQWWDTCSVLYDQFDGSVYEYSYEDILDSELDEKCHSDYPLIEIVQCKECKYGILEDNDDIYRCEYNGSDWNEGSYFCSYGERRK
jgi:hypothetical protein